MIRFFTFFAYMGLLFAPSMAADENPVVIELFASQNCPACPKAHRTLRSVVAEEEDVLVLTWSVDYWDYLGDPDPMAIPEAKARQAAYVDRLNLRAPYTPQSIYDGAKQCPATRRNQVDENIEVRRDLHQPQAPTISQLGCSITVSGPEKPPTVQEVVLIEYLPAEAHETGMVNPVISSRTIGLWSGEDMTLDVSCSQACAVLVQGQAHGEIIAAKALD